MLKKFFGRSQDASKIDSSDLTVDELIVLERWEEARERLEKEVKKHKGDPRVHMRLATVYGALGKGTESLLQYCMVADAYTRDGFGDKALAVLNKAHRLAPGDNEVNRRLYALQEDQNLAETQAVAKKVLAEAIKEQTGETASANLRIEVEKLWSQLTQTQFVRSLPPEQIEPLLSGMTRQVYGAERVLSRLGEANPFLFLVVEGGISIHDPTGPLLREFKRGTIHGESTLLEHQKWPAEYRTNANPTTLLVVDRAGLERSLTGNSNPKELIEYLRKQKNDATVREIMESVRASGS